ncbi:MAG: site-specific DNA-methyltransferase [Flavobacteriales bacterium]|nr:site-specific DNA-methyltransferase [Flavobacteriales bacterium]
MFFLPATFTMEKITATDPESHSADLLAANIAKLKELFPEVVAEGKVDFKALQEILGNEVETGEEFYRFTWAGKAQARREAHKPSTGTLRPAPEESVDWANTKNLYIEGDNLEVLKLLQKSYAGKVKMIYIDPPYNTGKDFVYKDNYRDNLRNYKELTGQVDSEGNSLSTNSDTDGRYHSNWLNMMYPRLRLARNLLREDGVIFISIDDNELSSLRSVADDVFGEGNFVANFIWEKRTNRENRKVVSNRHDYIVCFRRSDHNEKALYQLPMSEKALANYKNPDNDPRGPWKSDPATAQAGHATPSQFYTLTAPNGKQHELESGRCWLYTKEVMQEAIDDNRIWFGKTGNGVPRVKTYLESKDRGLTPESMLFAKDVSTTEIAKNDLKELFGGVAVFETPKPVELIEVLMRISASEGLVLDFFSGSGTTAHAVMQLNAEDGGQRQHIQVQLPEPTDAKSEAYKAGYKTIAEIGKERIRRAGKKIVSELEASINALEAKAVRTEEEEEELKQKQERLAKLDIGFRVFKLDSSNINAWDGDPERMQENLLSAAENIKPDRTEADVLYEVLLKYGLDLTLPIEERTIAKRTVYNVGSGALFLCLAEQITNAVAEGIGQWKEELKPETCRVIFRDNGFTDVEKTNAVQTLKRYGVTEVRSV